MRRSFGRNELFNEGDLAAFSVPGCLFLCLMRLLINFRVVMFFLIYMLKLSVKFLAGGVSVL
jgi:hypothetical protein